MFVPVKQQLLLKFLQAGAPPAPAGAGLILGLQAALPAWVPSPALPAEHQGLILPLFLCSIWRWVEVVMDEWEWAGYGTARLLLLSSLVNPWPQQTMTTLCKWQQANLGKPNSNQTLYDLFSFYFPPDPSISLPQCCQLQKVDPGGFKP